MARDRNHAQYGIDRDGTPHAMAGVEFGDLSARVRKLRVTEGQAQFGEEVQA